MVGRNNKGEKVIKSCNIKDSAQKEEKYLDFIVRYKDAGSRDVNQQYFYRVKPQVTGRISMAESATHQPQTGFSAEKKLCDILNISDHISEDIDQKSGVQSFGPDDIADLID